MLFPSSCVCVCAFVWFRPARTQYHIIIAVEPIQFAFIVAIFDSCRSTRIYCVVLLLIWLSLVCFPIFFRFMWPPPSRIRRAISLLHPNRPHVTSHSCIIALDFQSITSFTASSGSPWRAHYHGTPTASSAALNTEHGMSIFRRLRYRNGDHGQFSIAQRCQQMRISGCNHNRLDRYMQWDVENWFQSVQMSGDQLTHVQ